MSTRTATRASITDRVRRFFHGLREGLQAMDVSPQEMLIEDLSALRQEVRSLRKDVDSLKQKQVSDG